MHKLNIYISPLYIITAFFMIYFGAFDVFCYYLLALWFHEFGHYIVAKRLGYLLNTLDILPFVAMFSGNVNYKNNGHKLLVTLAGPIFNFILAIILIAVWWVCPSTYSYTKLFVEANLYLGIFNILPIFPFDGGQVLLAVINKRVRNKVYLVMKGVSILISILFMALFISSVFFNINFTLLCMSVFMFVTATQSYNEDYIDSIKSIEPKLDVALESKTYVVNRDVNFLKLTKYFSNNHFVIFQFVDNKFSNICTLNQSEILKEIERGKYFLK